MMDGAESVGEVFAITQDSKGFLWIGGKNGIARYDGYRFHRYLNSAADPHSLTSNYVRDILEDSHGDLWIATENGGVLRLNRDHDNFDRVENSSEVIASVEGRTFNHIFEDRQGNVWFAGAYGIGLYDRALHKIVKQFQRTVIDNHEATGISSDGDSGFAIALAGGFGYLNKRLDTVELFESKPHDPSALANNNVRAIITDSGGRIWLAHDLGISQFHPDTKRFDNYVIDNASTKSPGTPVWSIYQDKQNTLWLSTDGNGLMYFDPDTKRMGSYTASAYPSSLSNSAVRRVYQDKIGDLWVGMFPIGLNHFDHSNSYVSLYSNFVRNEAGMFRNQVWACLEDAKGNIWLGVDSLGLVYFDRKRKTFSQSYEGFDFSKLKFPNTVLSLFIDSHQNLWFGSWAQGIGRLNLKTKAYELFRDPAGGKQVFPARHAWHFFEAQDGTIYIGTTSDGFVTYSYETNQFTAHRGEVKISNNKTQVSDNVWDTRQDHDGNLWFATSSGIVIYDKKAAAYRRFIHDPNDESSVAENWIASFLEDSKGRLWVSTLGGGLDLWHPETQSFSHLRVGDGLISNSLEEFINIEHGRDLT